MYRDITPQPIKPNPVRIDTIPSGDMFNVFNFLLPVTHRIEILNKESEKLYLQGNIKDAISKLKEAINWDPKDLQLFFKLGYLFFVDQDYLKAVDCFSKIILEDENHLASFYYRGVCLSLIDQLDKALLDFNHILGVEPTNMNALMERAKIYLKKSFNTPRSICREFQDKAKFDFFATIRGNGASAEAYFHLAQIFHAQGMYLFAIRDYELAIKLWSQPLYDLFRDPERLYEYPFLTKRDVLSYCSHILIIFSKLKEIIREEEWGTSDLRLDENFEIKVLKLMARGLMSIWEIEQAIPPLQSILEKTSNDFFASVNLASIYAELGEFDQSFSYIYTFLNIREQNDRFIALRRYLAERFIQRAKSSLYSSRHRFFTHAVVDPSIHPQEKLDWQKAYLLHPESWKVLDACKKTFKRKPFVVNIEIRKGEALDFKCFYDFSEEGLRSIIYSRRIFAIEENLKPSLEEIEQLDDVSRVVKDTQIRYIFRRFV